MDGSCAGQFIRCVSVPVPWDITLRKKRKGTGVQVSGER